MEPLPQGANFLRAKTLWEIGLHLAAAQSAPPDEPGTAQRGNRDMCIVIGSGTGAQFQPRFRLANGTASLVHAVVRGDIEVAFVNPSAILTQAYRGTGMFASPQPVRVLATVPTWDRCVGVVHPRTGIRTLAQVGERRYPLRLSIRANASHASRVLLDQMLAVYGFTLTDLQSWGGTLELCNTPGDARRLALLRAGELDLIFDEGIRNFFEESLALGMQPLVFEDAMLQHLEAIGWRRAPILAGRYAHLSSDYVGIDFGGWPLYTRAELPEEDAYNVCAALAARVDEIPWLPGEFTGMGQLGQDTDATPRDVPLHAGAARWYREHDFAV